jgi:cytochrome c551/c552
MPRFYGVSNNDTPADQPKSDAEIHAITHYLFAKSAPPAEFGEVKEKGVAAKGKELFLQKGCLACHAHRPYVASEVQPQDQKRINPKYKPDTAATWDPSIFPESVRGYAKADYGPNLSNIAAKFQSHDQGYQWLANWIKNPDAYHPKSLMPNLQLSAQDSADIAAWIISVPGQWPVNVEVPPVDAPDVQKALDELLELYVSKAGSFTLGDRKDSVALSEVGEFVSKKLSREDKLMYLGEKTISRLGCFGCHNIKGFETAKPIGTPLNGWGTKSPAKLDFGHIAEFIDDQKVDEKGDRDGTPPYFQEKLAEHTRAGFLYQKLHRPRSYDYRKTNEDLKTWDDRLRMPQFSFANDPKAVEEVMTFVLGLTGERIAARYLPKPNYNARQIALAEGAKALNRYNCSGCHVLEMPKYTVPDGMKVTEAFPNFKTNLRASYSGRATDFLEGLYPGLKYDEKAALTPDKIESSLGLEADRGKTFTIEGMPIGQFENELTVQLWKPVTIRGYTFNIGDTVTLDASKVSDAAAAEPAKIKKTAPDGGNFAWLYSTYVAERTGGDFAKLWDRLPPPLVREGNKVQTPWLKGFLKDPYSIRPAANLRMPRFHYGNAISTPDHETTRLANYFPARDGADFPYQSIPERSQAYLAERTRAHPDYFAAGMSMMSGKGSPCISCHAVGPSKPTGGETVVNGPDLRQVAPRLRPEFLEVWLAKPSRLVPYTAMPQNIVPHGAVQIPVPKTFEDKPLEMVRAIRDTLLNYVDAVEQQLASGAKPTADAGAPASAPKPAGAAQAGAGQ